MDQLGDGGRSIHDLDKQRRRLEVSPKKETLLHYSALFPSTGGEGGASGGIRGGRGGFGTGGKQGWCDGKVLRIKMQNVGLLLIYKQTTFTGSEGPAGAWSSEAGD